MANQIGSSGRTNYNTLKKSLFLGLINRLEQGIKGGYISLFDQFDYFVVRCHFIPVYY